MITAKMKALLHVAKARLGLSDKEYRALLRGAAGVSSSVDLDEVGFDLVMEEFARRGFRSTANRRDGGQRPGMATPRQIAFIRQLWGDYTGGEGTESGLRKWLEHSFHIGSPRFLTAETAGKAIQGLKAMTARRAGDDAA